MSSRSERKIILKASSNKKDMYKNNIAIVGSGTVGTATGVVLQKKGFNVTFVDNNVDVLNKLKTDGYKTSFVEDTNVNLIDTFFISVPTYISDDNDGMSFMQKACENIGTWLAIKKDYSLVVVRSTVLPGTTERIVIPIIERNSGKKAGVDFGVCVNPEYLREKSAASDFENPWLIVIGEMNKRDGDILEGIYSWVSCPIYRIPVKEAEMQKFVHNILNANKISFFNEMRLACREMGLDYDQIFLLVTKSAEAIWNPVYGTADLGPFGGSCLPKDSKTFMKFARENLKTDMKILRAMTDLNTELIQKRDQEKQASNSKFDNR